MARVLGIPALKLWQVTVTARDAEIGEEGGHDPVEQGAGEIFSRFESEDWEIFVRNSCL